MSRKLECVSLEMTDLETIEMALWHYKNGIKDMFKVCGISCVFVKMLDDFEKGCRLVVGDAMEWKLDMSGQRYLEVENQKVYSVYGKTPETILKIIEVHVVSSVMGA